MAAGELQYRPDVDGLRAVAVLSVVLCHAGLGVPGGYVGVDVFFVISGYLITGIVLKELREGRFTLSGFWLRRVRRILPALVVVAAATLVTGWFVLLPADFKSYGRSLSALVLMAANVHFWRGTNYFADEAETSPLLHTWSLAVEEQFYLVLPTAMVIYWKLFHTRGLLVLLLLAAATSLLLSAYEMPRHPHATFYLLPTRAWELLAGSALARLPARAYAGRWGGEAAACIGAACVIIPCFTYDRNTPFPGVSAVPPVAGAALCIWGGSNPHGLPLVSRLLSSRPAVFVGLISYSLYLWHWPILVFTRYVSYPPPSVSESWLLVAASILMAWASWALIEEPIRRKRVASSPLMLTGVLSVAGVVLAGSGLAIYSLNGFPERLSNEAKRFDLPDPPGAPDLDVGDVPGNLIRYGRPSDRADLLVWGDSHAGAILPAIKELSEHAGVCTAVAVHGGTAPVIDYYHVNRFGLCERSIPFSNAVVRYVQSANVGKVLLAAYWSLYAGDPAFDRALLETVAQLRYSGARVYILKAVPSFSVRVPQALATSVLIGRDTAVISTTVGRYEEQNHAMTRLFPALSREGVILLDPIPCLRTGPGSQEIAALGGEGPLYRDHIHLSVHGARRLKPLLGLMFE